jgi:Ca2+-transporting ATPase
MKEDALRPWYHQDIHDVPHQFGTDATQGLDPAKAARHLVEYGPNELVERGARSRWRISWEQRTSTMVVILN